MITLFSVFVKINSSESHISSLLFTAKTSFILSSKDQTPVKPGSPPEVKSTRGYSPLIINIVSVSPGNAIFAP